MPPLIAPLIVGAEMTRPSRVMPTCLPTLAAVYSAQAAEPALLKSSWTIHSPVLWRVPAVASVTSVPSTTAGPSRYLALPSSLQAAT